MKKIFVSVLIPVFNTEKYLKKCLDSVLNQTERNIQVVCVNDGSTDDSGKILAEYATKDERLTVVTQENAGLPSARNAGLDRAKGEYVLFVDSDDFLEKDAIKRAYKKAKKAKADVVVFGANILTDSPYVSSWLKSVLSPRDRFYGDFSPRTLFSERGARPFLWRDLIKRDLIEKNGLRLVEDVVVGEDQAFQFRFFTKAKRVLFCSDKLYDYRVDRADSIMTGVKGDIFRRVEAHLLLVRRVFDQAKKDGVFDDLRAEFFVWGTSLLYNDALKLFLPERIIASKRILSLLQAYDYVKKVTFLPQKVQDMYSYFEFSATQNPNSPKVSIIVDATGADVRIEDFFRSVKGQSETSFELLLLCGGAKDYERLRKFTSSDCRARLFNVDDGRGRCGLRNEGLRQARGEYIFFCSFEDVFSSPFSLQNFLFSGENILFGRAFSRTKTLETLQITSFAVKREVCARKNLFFEGESTLFEKLFMVKAMENEKVGYADEPFVKRIGAEEKGDAAMRIRAYLSLLKRTEGTLFESILLESKGEELTRSAEETGRDPFGASDVAEEIVKLSSLVEKGEKTSNGTALLPCFASFVRARREALDEADER